MAKFSKDEASKREKTLLSAALLSSPGPLVTGLAAMSSQSPTQLADFIRRSAELVALFVSWWVFRYIQRNQAESKEHHQRLEHIAELSVAGAMVFSGIVMLIIAISQFSNYELSGKVVSGLIIAILGFLVNTWFWRRYARLTREQFNPVTAAQVKLYRAKSWVDLCVVAALTTITIAPQHPASQYVDIIGSIAVAFYLIYSGIDTFRSSKKH